MKLYDIAGELATLHDHLEQTGGELTPDLEASLDGLQMAFSDKVANIGRWVLNVAASEKALTAEIDRLTAKRLARRNLQDRLKEYVKQAMDHAGVKKIEGDAFTWRIQANPPSVEIADQTKIPMRFRIIIPESFQVDKKKVLDALKSGERIGGAVLVTDKTHVRLA